MGAEKKIPSLIINEKKKSILDISENNHLKADVERMKKLLTEKIKDPNLAKKAAMIISEMINQKN